MEKIYHIVDSPEGINKLVILEENRRFKVLWRSEKCDRPEYVDPSMFNFLVDLITAAKWCYIRTNDEALVKRFLFIEEL